MSVIKGAPAWQQTRVLLGELLDSASDAMLSFEPDGQITLVNSQAEQVFGYSREELTGRPIEVLLPERFCEVHVRHRRGLARTLHAKSMGSRLTLFGRRKDGSEFPAEISLSAVHAVDGELLLTSTIRDITDRTQAEAARLAAEEAQLDLQNLMNAVHSSESMFRATFEQAAAGMAHVALDGRWLRVNQRLCDIVRYSREELLERTFQDITYPADLDADLECVQQLLDGLIDTYTLDKRYLRKDGSTVWIALTVSLVRHDDGSPDYFIAVVQDIGARRQAEQQLALQATQQAFLAEAGLLLARSLDNEATLSQVARLAVPLLGDWCTVYLREPIDTGGPQIRRVAAAHADPAKQQLLDKMGDLVPVNESAPVGVPRVIRTGRPQLVGELNGGELQNVARSPEHWQLLQALGAVYSLLTVPLIVAGETLGAMVFAACDPARRHVPEDRALALELAGRCAQAIYNARLYQARQAAEARIAQEAARALVLAQASKAFAAASLNTRTLLDGIARCVGQAMGDTCVVVLQTRESTPFASVGVYHRDAVEAGELQTLLAAGGEPVAVDSSAEQAARRTADSLPDLTAQEKESVGRELMRLQERLCAHCIAAAPLRVARELLGVVSLWRNTPRSEHDNTDLVLLQDLADRGALALEAARRFEQSLAAIRVRDDVLAAVSHDLKAPLTSILGNAQLVKQFVGRTEPNPERLTRSVERIVSSSRRMADMMDELVDAARLEAGQVLVLHRATVDIAALARSIVSEQQVTANKHALYVTGETELYGLWDAARLRRVLENLLGNAIKYSPDGGDVRVDIAREYSGRDSSQWAVLRIVDQGIGIPDGDIPHLFERFRRGGNATQIAGTGLGLSGAKQIIEQHGGQLELTSEEDVGSTFTIRLPLLAPTS
jgi:PAS domain S-box-containing protein